jgi:diaminohydroxyphosphoribosylaminopyrimidine deaminase/5-amino-6-(5-phosphoribosylamino)uracil reductase
MPTAEDLKYMRRVLTLARKGMGCTSPNPMVGALLVKQDRVIGEGYHQCFGGPHAEIVALKGLTKRETSGATLYVNLEPCRHYGKTPPCLPAILESGVRRVVIGTTDPNPPMDGKSVQEMRRKGVEVELGVLDAQCRELNRGYFKHITTGIPWVTVKIAQTLDGRIADPKGSSRWITGEASREKVHSLRATHDAVLVGVGTVIKDNPQLTVRHVKGHQPQRIVLDPRLEIPHDALLLKDRESGSPWIITGETPNAKRRSELESLGAKLIAIPSTGRQFQWEHILTALGKNGITTVLIEGGNAVFTSILKQKAADRIIVIIAPKLLGSMALPAIGDLRIGALDKALDYQITAQKRLGDDIWVELKSIMPELKS